jgi:hypothetical protein
MLMETDWHPIWISYEWWRDIGVPTLGAIGSVAVGVGAIVVAVRSAQIAKAATDREDDAAKRTDRRVFGLLATKWLTVAVDDLFRHGIDSLFEDQEKKVGDKEQRSVGDYKQELDTLAAATGQYSVELLESTQKRLDQVGELGTSRGRALAILSHRYLLQSIQAWTADPLSWYEMELETRRDDYDVSRFVARLPAGRLDQRAGQDEHP